MRTIRAREVRIRRPHKHTRKRKPTIPTFRSCPTNINKEGATEGPASISTADDEAMTASTVGLFSNSAIEDHPNMVGRLPGEWSFPVGDHDPQ